MVVTEKRSPPRVIFHGEDFLLEDLPLGTRVVFARAPVQGVPNPKAAIRWALNHPEGMDPLHALLQPGDEGHHRARRHLAAAAADASLPTSARSVLEIVLELLADSGVDDVHLIIANALHRRMTDAEMKRMVGEKIFNAFHPDRYYNHDAEDPDGIVELERTAQGEVVALNRRAAESDLLIYVNINLVPMDGGHKSVGTGLANYASLRAHHNPKTIRESESYMEPSKSALHRSTERIGRVIDQHLKVFHIETVLNNRMFDGPTAFLGKREEDFTEVDRLKFQALRYTLSKLPRVAKRKLMMSIPAPYDIIAVNAGATEPCHEKTLEACWRQYSVPVQGQSDIVIWGVPYISPYNVNSILNPLLVQVMGLGYLFNLNRGVPLVKKGGVVILCHPCLRRVRSRAPPELHRVLQPTSAGDARRDGARAQIREGIRHQSVLRPPLPEGARLPRGPPLLHVVLGREWPSARRQGHRRRGGKQPCPGAPGLGADRHAGRGHRLGPWCHRTQRVHHPGEIGAYSPD